jgi:hypothetical protein
VTPPNLVSISPAGNSTDGLGYVFDNLHIRLITGVTQKDFSSQVLGGLRPSSTCGKYSKPRNIN